MVEVEKEVIDGIPRLILVLAYRFSFLDKSTFVNLKKDKTGSLIFDTHRLERFAYAMLWELKRKEKRYLIENSFLLTGRMNQKEVCLFEYDGWIINITELQKGEESRSGIYAKSSYNRLMLLDRISIALILTENFGPMDKQIAGIDFYSRRWVKRLSEEIPLPELFVKYLKVALKSPNYRIFIESIRTDSPDGYPDMENESLMVMKFVSTIAVNLWVNTKEFDDELEIPYDMRIAVDTRDNASRIYWVELGEYYFIASNNSVNGYEVGLIKDLKYVASYNETYSRYLWDIGFRGIDLSAPEYGNVNH